MESRNTVNTVNKILGAEDTYLRVDKDEIQAYSFAVGLEVKIKIHNTSIMNRLGGITPHPKATISDVRTNGIAQKTSLTDKDEKQEIEYIISKYLEEDRDVNNSNAYFKMNEILNK